MERIIYFILFYFFLQKETNQQRKQQQQHTHSQMDLVLSKQMNCTPTSTFSLFQYPKNKKTTTKKVSVNFREYENVFHDSSLPDVILLDPSWKRSYRPEIMSAVGGCISQVNQDWTQSCLEEKNEHAHMLFVMWKPFRQGWPWTACSSHCLLTFFIWNASHFIYSFPPRVSQNLTHVCFMCFNYLQLLWDTWNFWRWKHEEQGVSHFSVKLYLNNSVQTQAILHGVWHSVHEWVQQTMCDENEIP